MTTKSSPDSPPRPPFPAESPVRDPELEELRLETFHGLVTSAYCPLDPAIDVPRLVDPAAALETLHWGRNYLYAARLQTTSGPLEVVVKQFRNQGLKERWRRRLRGSKAWRSWHIARALRAAGVSTPEPVLLVESNRPDGPSFFVTRRIPDFLEARYLLRAVNAGTAQQEFPNLAIEDFLDALARILRKMHGAGLWHRDVSIGNVLIRIREDGELELYLVDLNRARRRRRLTVHQRTRDLCRLAIFSREHQKALVETYWGTESRGLGLKMLLYLGYHYSFRWRTELKKHLRKAAFRVREWVLPRRVHAHIPAAPPDASTRDRIVWDKLSDQPHQHATRLEKLRVRLADGGVHFEQGAAVLGVAPRIWRRYRKLRSHLYQQPLPWQGMGICLRPRPEGADELLTAVEELGVRKILIRLHPWERDHAAEESLAAELHRRGYELAFALPQNRDLVKDLGRWRGAVEEIGERFRPFGRHFQVGQAINRSKWGIWNYREYLTLATAACEILRRNEGVEILGPSVIDFEFQATAAVLNLRHSDLYFDVVSSLLYVDRRGAPENRQLGFDTVDKVVLLRAIAETARNSGGRCWITEVNWPLWEGPHAPAGRGVAVDEQTQADYLARYFLLVLGTGLVERVYWWQLAARGYGLLDPSDDGSMRRRQAFRVMAALARTLEGTELVSPLPASPGGRLYLFRRPSQQIVVGWSVCGITAARLPGAAAATLAADGHELRPPEGREVSLAPSPCYWILEEEPPQ
jgi:tRNA A-37 threonylcarbamoyl transferase component Bud32